MNVLGKCKADIIRLFTCKEMKEEKRSFLLNEQEISDGESIERFDSIAREVFD